MDNKNKTKHDVPKCTCCGTVGTYKTERMITPLYRRIGWLLILFWLIPKPDLRSDSKLVSGVLSFITHLPVSVPMRYFSKIGQWVLTWVPVNFNEMVREPILRLYGMMSGPERLMIAPVIGVIYFGTLMVLRHKKEKRSRICTQCGSIDRFTFYY